MDNPDGLIDSIYDCALLPELWPGVLDRLSRIAGAQGGILFADNGRVANWTASGWSRETMARFAASDAIVRSSRFAGVVGLQAAGFVRDNDPSGWAVATAFRMPTGDTVVLALEGERARGPAEFRVLAHLDALRPHIARSSLLSARLQFERARVASETLAVLGLPALVLDTDGRVITANAAAEGMGDYLCWGAQLRISIKDVAADRLFQRAMRRLDGIDGETVLPFVVPDCDVRPGLIAHLIPIRGTARDLFVRSAAILVLTPVSAPQAPSAELIQSLFDLTPAEAEVARNLASGETVTEIADKGGVSTNTVRSQVRGILGKTGCRRQTDVISLIVGMSRPFLTRRL